MKKNGRKRYVVNSNIKILMLPSIELPELPTLKFDFQPILDEVIYYVHTCNVTVSTMQRYHVNYDYISVRTVVNITHQTDNL